MKKIIAARDKEFHDSKIAEASKYLEKCIECLEKARPEAWNGDSSGNLLRIINDSKRVRKGLQQYRSGKAIRSWEGY